MKKLISVFTALTTILWLSGVAMILPVSAATFADGDIVREADEFDVYIIKLVGDKKFKRLILNPDVFNMYGHLKWENIQVVADGELADYTTSELVRADGDEKVYKLYPDGDTGTKKWVETLDCFTNQGFDWDSVYVINSFDRDSYTTASETLCGGTTEEGDITLSLASNTPSADTLPQGAASIVFTRVRISGSGTISQLVVTRDGAGDTDDFSNVYIYEGENRLTSGRSISSSTSKVTFINLDIQAPTTIDIVGDLDVNNDDAGNVHYFSIESASDVTSNATVGGSFPISGNAMAISGTTAGTLAVVDSGSTSYNVTIGEKEVEISQFKVTAASEGADIYRIRLYNGGTINSTKLQNVKLKVSDETLATVDSVGTDGYITFVLDSPYYIKKGSNAIFRVYADIAGGKPAETIELYVELETDIKGIGRTYGFGMDPTITGFDSTDSGEAIDVTLQGGDLTLVKVGPNASNIARETDDTVFLEYSISAAADITISRTRLYWCVDQAGNGVYDDPQTTEDSDSFDDVEDVKIVNKDTGVVWAGPHDGSAFTNNADNYCTGDVDGIYKDFTDTYDLTAGDSYNLQVTADVKYANTAAEDNDAELDSGDIVKVGLYSYVDAAFCGNANYMKYTGTTNSVACTAIIPSGDILGEEMTLQAPALAVALAAVPSGTDSSGAIGTARPFVKGKTGVDTVGLVFTAGVASDVTVTDISLTSYVDCDGDGTYVAGKEDTSCYVKNLVSSVEIWDTTTNAKVPGSTAEGFSGTNYKTSSFTGLSWTIPAGESRTLLVKSNLSSIGPTESGGFDMISFDIDAASTDITSQDEDSNTIDETGNDANGATNPNVAIGIYDQGSITLAAANDTPLESVVLMGSSNNEVSKFKLTGSREAFYVSRFSVEIDEDTASRGNYTGIALKYQTESQWGTSDWTISSDKVFADDATISFDFSDSARPYIPKDDDSYITALVDVNSYNAGTGANSGDYTNFWLAAATGAGTNEFKAYGAESGTLLDADDVTEPATTGFKNHYIFRSKPVFAKKAWSGDINELARFTITAEGYDVTFDGTSSDGGWVAAEGHPTYDDVVSAALEFTVIASGTQSTAQRLYLYDWNNDIISSVYDITLSHADAVAENISSSDSTCDVADGSTFEGCLTTVSFAFEEASSAVVIPQNTTKEFYIMIDNTVDFNNQDEYLQLKLMQDEGDITGAPGGSNNTFDQDNCGIVWYDGTDDEATRAEFEHAICMPSNIEGIGDFPMSFRLLQGTAQ